MTTISSFWVFAWMALVMMSKPLWASWLKFADDLLGSFFLGGSVGVLDIFDQWGICKNLCRASDLSGTFDWTQSTSSISSRDLKRCFFGKSWGKDYKWVRDMGKHGIITCFQRKMSMKEPSLHYIIISFCQAQCIHFETGSLRWEYSVFWQMTLPSCKTHILANSKSHQFMYQFTSLSAICGMPPPSRICLK